MTPDRSCAVQPDGRGPPWRKGTASSFHACQGCSPEVPAGPSLRMLQVRRGRCGAPAAFYKTCLLHIGVAAPSALHSLTTATQYAERGAPPFEINEGQHMPWARQTAHARVVAVAQQALHCLNCIAVCRAFNLANQPQQTAEHRIVLVQGLWPSYAADMVMRLSSRC